MIEDQLDHLIDIGTTTNSLLTQILAKLGGTPVPPDPPIGNEKLIFEQKLWKSSDISSVAGASWISYDRPLEGTFAANLSLVASKLQFNKKQSQPGGFGSSVIAKQGITPIKLKQLRIVIEVTFNDGSSAASPKWVAYPLGCKTGFFAVQDGANHTLICNNGYDNKLRPSLGLQSPFMTYYCDYEILLGKTFVHEVTMNFAEKWLEMKVDGVPRLINPTAWVAPSVLRVPNVLYGFDVLNYNLFQIDPTEPATTLPAMSHTHGPISVYGIPA